MHQKRFIQILQAYHNYNNSIPIPYLRTSEFERLGHETGVLRIEIRDCQCHWRTMTGQALFSCSVWDTEEGHLMAGLLTYCGQRPFLDHVLAIRRGISGR